MTDMIIDTKKYPYLKGLCWSRPDVATLSGPEALGLYENNWCLVGKLGSEEQVLLDALVENFGNGVFMPRG